MQKLDVSGEYWWIVPVVLLVAFLTSVAAFVLLTRKVVRRLGVVADALERMAQHPTTTPRPTSLAEIFRLAGTDVGVQLIIVRMQAGYVGEVRTPDDTLASAGPLEVSKPDHILWELEAKLHQREKLPS